MKGENKMSKKMNPFEGMKLKFKAGSFPMPPVPPMPFAPRGRNAGQETDNERVGARKENVKSTLKSFLLQNIDLQKVSADNSRKQWNQFFDYMLEMQATFAESLPDDISSLPFGQMIAVSPKSFMKRLENFEKMANDHFVEQADSVADFFIKGQEQAIDLISAAFGGPVESEVVDEQEIVEEYEYDEEEEDS